MYVCMYVCMCEECKCEGSVHLKQSRQKVDKYMFRGYLQSLTFYTWNLVRS